MVSPFTYYEVMGLWCWRRLLRVPWTARRSNQSILKEIGPEYSILWAPDWKNWFIGKDSDAGKDRKQEEKGTREEEMVGWHHRLDGHEFEQAPGIGDGREAWCAAVHGVAELDMIFVFWMLSFKPAFSLSSFTFITRLFSSSLLSAIKGGIICISEVIDSSPGSDSSSLAFYMMYSANIS